MLCQRPSNNVGLFAILLTLFFLAIIESIADANKAVSLQPKNADAYFRKGYGTL